MWQQDVLYEAENINARGFICFPEGKAEQYPAVIVVHDWTGRNQFACDKTKLLAEMGYVGFAVDMYGDAKCGSNHDENSKLMTPLMENRELLLQRLMDAYNRLISFSCVDKQRIAIIGFCFGGLCALDLARSGADIKAAVSFHGILKAPPMANKTIKAKVLVLHGHDDPMVTPQQVADFSKEMTKAKVDWQIHLYGNTMHAFTNPQANDRSFGTVYDATAANRAWLSMQNFFKEVFVE